MSWGLRRMGILRASKHLTQGIFLSCEIMLFSYPILVTPRRDHPTSAWKIEVTNNLLSLLVTCWTRTLPYGCCHHRSWLPTILYKAWMLVLSVRCMPFELEDLSAVSFITKTIDYTSTKFCLLASLGLHPYRRLLRSFCKCSSKYACCEQFNRLLIPGKKLIKWTKLPRTLFLQRCPNSQTTCCYYSTSHIV